MTEILQQDRVSAVSDVHRAYLNEHAVTDETIAAQGIRSEGDVIVFTWREDDRVTEQRRPWPGESGVYFWEPEKKLHLNILRDPGPGAPVIIAEGTKQSLAVASWAPPEYAVYGMPGCYGWVTKGDLDLSRFAGRQVLIMLDADAADNLDVWEAGTRLAHELGMEEPPAQVSFIPSPAWGKDGIDDYLARIAENRRADRLAKLIAGAQAKPADSKPTKRKAKEQFPDTAGRPMVVVNRDRMMVIRDILGHIQQRWGGKDLFCYGGVLARLRGSRAEPLDSGAFAAWLAEGIFTCRYRRPTAMAPGEYEPEWPDQQSMNAVLSLADRFPPLHRIARVPFFRADGTACFKNGYDWDTGTFLACGNSGMDRLDIPDAPSREQAAEQARYMLGNWLGDMPFKDDSSRASALALVLTPFIRGLVPLVPLAVVSGLQPGVGKGLFGDCVSILVTGQAQVPLPYVTDDEDEIRKQITAAFRQGADLFCFDEAHDIKGAALCRALTSITYTDRILGVSKMAEFPNQVTWMSLGNQVSVNADMNRRAHWIELHPDCPDPQDRPESAFTHPDLRSWTTENRPELVTAALIIIRSWFAAGCPAHSRGSLMGSFESWDKMMSGILHWAGVSGFLGGLADRRAEADFSGSWWGDHVAWLYRVFGTENFTAADVKTKVQALAGQWDAPPDLDDVMSTGYARRLGQAWARVQGRWFSGLRLDRRGRSHDNTLTWGIQVLGDENGGNNQETNPDLGGGQHGGNTGVTTNLPGTGGVHNESTHPDLGVYRPVEGNSTLTCEGGKGVTGVTPKPTRERAPAHDAGAHTREGARARAEVTPVTPVTPAGNLAIAVDLETDDASRLFLAPRGAAPGDGGFVRLAGAIGPGGGPVIAPVGDVLAMTELADRVDTHNGMGFDGLALAWHHGADWNRLAAKIRDTELIMRQVDPPRSRESGGASADRYDLDHVAEKLGVAGKTDELARLKAKHGGWGAIPLDDPEYRGYLEGDLRATAAVSAALMPYYDMDPYIRREHQLAEIAGQMALSGFAVDRPLLAERLAEVNQAKADAARALHDGWGLPLSKTVTRGRGKAKHEEQELMGSPLSTDIGRDWLASQWSRYGIASPPLTDTGKLALGADVLRPIAADPRCPEDLRQMLALMETITTARTVYQTATENLAPDGRVHARVSMRQASGRWSVTKPGLTVFGKRGGRHVERDIFTADDEDSVLISCDLSQVDMRAMAGHSQDPAYMAMFGWDERGVPLDPHTMIAEQVFGDAGRRHDAKAVGHGWNYGLGAPKMIREGMDPEKVYGFINGMEARFGGLIAWRESIREMGKAGQILENGFGRRMRCDPARAYTVAPALMGQGGARDIMCESLLRLPRELYPFLRVMVHDEIVLSVPRRAAEEVGHVVREAMTWTWRGVPILCDMSTGRTWGEVSAH